MEKEEWMDVRDYEGLYQVSNQGRVYSLPKEGKGGHNGKILGGGIDSKGYPMVNLCKDGNQKTITTHKLVAMTFLNHTPDGCNIVIDHIDNDKTNNNVENLQLISHRENSSKDRKGGSSKYVGVCWHKSRGKWMSYIQINGKTEYLGHYDNELDASETYQLALSKIN